MSVNNLPDNALLRWLQDESNNNYLELKNNVESMYNIFADGSLEDQMTLLQEDDRHHCFLIFTPNEEDKPTGTILHHMAKYPKRIGVSTAYDGNWYVSANQPIGGTQITYTVPSDLFGVCKDIQVYTADRIQREIGNNPDLTTLPVVASDANVADIKQVNTYRGMWLPNQYAALCLEEGLSPAEVWSRLYGQVLQDGASDACKPLLMFLQVPILSDVMVNAAIYDPVELPIPRPRMFFHRHCMKVMSHLMPPSSATSANQTSGPMTSGLSTDDFQKLVVAMRQGHGAPPANTATHTQDGG